MKHNATIAYYINNLASAKLPQKAANSLLDFAEGVSTELLGYDLCDHWGISPDKKVRRGRIRIPVDTSDAGNTSDVPCTRSIKKLRDIMSGLLVIDICSAGIDKCMDSLTNLFGLNETERRLVQLFADNVRDSQVRALIHDVMCDNCRFRTCLDLYNLDMIAAMCGLSYAAVNRALDPDGLLVRAGILAIDDSDGEITLNRFISRHLTDGITSVPELKRALLGKPHIADKGLDFSHKHTDLRCDRHGQDRHGKAHCIIVRVRPVWSEHIEQMSPGKEYKPVVPDACPAYFIQRPQVCHHAGRSRRYLSL